MMTLSTDDRQAIIGVEAWECHRRIVDLRNQAEQTFLDLGKELAEFKEKEFWRQFGHLSFESYLADPEVDLGRSTAYKSIREHKIYIGQYDCPPVTLLEAGTSKLDRLATRIEKDQAEGYEWPRDDVIEWTEKAAGMSRSDFIEELREAFGEDAVSPLPIDYRRMAWLWKQLARKYYRLSKGDKR